MALLRTSGVTCSATGATPRLTRTAWRYHPVSVCQCVCAVCATAPLSTKSVCNSIAITSRSKSRIIAPCLNQNLVCQSNIIIAKTMKSLQNHCVEDMIKSLRLLTALQLRQICHRISSNHHTQNKSCLGAQYTCNLLPFPLYTSTMYPQKLSAYNC